VQVWVETANPGERLRAGVAVHVTFVAETIQNAVVAPAAALLSAEEGGTQVIAVGADGVAHVHKIEAGVRDGEKVQILSGVKAGEQVVTVGGLGLDDGAKVEVEKERS
jgi:multidrug efflux pump subunit AcrA (membrane-fusion protein)